MNGSSHLRALGLAVMMLAAGSALAAESGEPTAPVIRAQLTPRRFTTLSAVL